jgi:hypothetical protein
VRPRGAIGEEGWCVVSVVKLVNHINLTLGRWRKEGELTRAEGESGGAGLIELGGGVRGGCGRCEKRWSSGGPFYRRSGREAAKASERRRGAHRRQ